MVYELETDGYDTEAALEQVTEDNNTHPMKSNVDDTQPRESVFEDTHTGESVVGDTHLWDSDVDYLYSWDWSDVDDTHPGDMLTSPTRGNLMLTPTPGKLMLTSPTRGRESDVEDGQSQNPAFEKLSHKQCPNRWTVLNWVNEPFANILQRTSDISAKNPNGNQKENMPWGKGFILKRKVGQANAGGVQGTLFTDH